MVTLNLWRNAIFDLVLPTLALLLPAVKVLALLLLPLLLAALVVLALVPCPLLWDHHWRSPSFIFSTWRKTTLNLWRNHQRSTWLATFNLWCNAHLQFLACLPSLLLLAMPSTCAINLAQCHFQLAARCHLQLLASPFLWDRRPLEQSHLQLFAQAPSIVA
jgi:hypothetical protein